MGYQALTGKEQRMLNRSLAGIALAFVLITLAGCTVVQKGETVVKYDKGEQPIMGQATTDGQFSLYRTTDATPMVTYNLKAGDKLGFERSTDAQLYAVAGQNRVPVSNESYYWKHRY
jgi:hypothetical protein